MKPKIPFRIGYQYDNWELDLISIENRIKDSDLYSSYLWVGNRMKKFLNFTPDRTELIFHWDRLEVVILRFSNKSKGYYDKLNQALLQRFPDYTTETNSDEDIIFKYNTLKVSYWNIYYPKTNKIKVMYFSKSFPPKELILKYNQIQLPQTFEELENMFQELKNEVTELLNLKKVRQLTISEEHHMKKSYENSLALRFYLKKEGKVSNQFITFYLYFLFKDRRKWR
ncbi:MULTISPECIES: hypothetical protein [unclassified Chryseobacterium]|uniref:hypothetical protein n=1 Tax=unclassified Chryseobacterium TaxID=2593645 RepID=UPI002269C544|nr:MULTISPECIES: hypothetical protein [unclassified Chryseobacterium]